MTKKNFLTLCTCINGVFIATQIYKHTQFVHYMYQKQQEEESIHTCEETVNKLKQQLYALQDRATIKEFAQKELGMRTIALHQVKRLDL
ncbi:MAG TPA: hypothetical protein VGW78_02535 [Candidatus Babeliales bacterium]|jgi:cell division protein FtsB|nr:hypothetical protein [Candidatus Babeliales bacterium]